MVKMNQIDVWIEDGRPIMLTKTYVNRNIFVYYADNYVFYEYCDEPRSSIKLLTDDDDVLQKFEITEEAADFMKRHCGIEL